MLWVINQQWSCVSHRGDWMCSLCRTDQEPAGTYSYENLQACGGVTAPYTLSSQDQRVSSRESESEPLVDSQQSQMYSKNLMENLQIRRKVYFHAQLSF